MIPDAQAEKATPVLNDTRHIYNQGTEQYSKGEFEKATETLRKSLSTPDLKLQQRGYYNLGNSLFRQGQSTLEKNPEATIKTWEESVKAYADALVLDPKDEDAEFNKKLVEKKLEELKKQENKDQNEDKKDDKEDKEKEDQKDDQKDQKDKGGEDKKEPSDQKKDGKPGDENKEGEPDKQEPGKEPEDKPEDEKQDKTQQGKEGEEKDKEQEAQAGEASEERGEKQEMSKEQAAQLLQALQGDERSVIPIPQQRATRMLTPENSTKGKTW